MKPSETGEALKKCRICGVEKPVDAYYWRKDAKQHRTECKVCTSDHMTLRRVGITFNEMLMLEIRAGGHCECCGSKLNSSRYTRMAIDHDHVTKKVRGLLCTNCNTAIGLMKDSPLRLRQAAAYLEGSRYSLNSAATQSPMAATEEKQEG